MISLLVCLFVSKLYARLNVFNYTKETYGQETLVLIRDLKRQRTKLAKIESDIGSFVCIH